MYLGKKIICNYGYDFHDKTTTDKIYEIVEINNGFFKIINDEGKLIMPIESTFRDVK